MQHLPAFLLSACLLLTALPGSAQSSSTGLEQQLLREFGQANGGTVPPLTTDLPQVKLYVTMVDGSLIAITNYRSDPEQKTLNILPLEMGRLDSTELSQLFAGAPAGFDLTRLPVQIHSKVFQFFMNAFLVDDRFPNVTVISLQGKSHPFRYGLAEVRPGFLVAVTIQDLDDLNSFFFERGFDPAEMEALSLINNQEVNAVLSGVFPHFQAIRTENHIENAFQKSRQKSFCLFAHIGADGQLTRYLSSGAVSYELPATQFLHLSADLQKEIILVGINYADDTSRTIDLPAETKRLGDALQHRKWGDVLPALAGPENEVHVSEQNSDGFYFKRAEVSRPEGAKPSRAYSFIFFKTPPKPPAILAGLRFVYGHSGKILSVLIALQLLFFFVFKGAWTRTWKWINLVFTLIFVFIFAFSL